MSVEKGSKQSGIIPDNEWHGTQIEGWKPTDSCANGHKKNGAKGEGGLVSPATVESGNLAVAIINGNPTLGI